MGLKAYRRGSSSGLGDGSMRAKGALLVVLALVASGCGSDSDSDNAARKTPATGPVTVTDWTKTKVTLDAPATRVACLIGSCVDALAELGMVPVLRPDDASKGGLREYFGDRAAIPQVGGNFFEPNLEDIAAAKPDLVIGGACFHEGLRQALKPIAPLVIVDIGTFQLAESNLRTIANLTGRTDQADEPVGELRAKIAAYADRAPKDVVPVSVYPTPDAPLIDSSESQVGSLLKATGEYPWPPFSGEFDCFGGGQITYSMEKVLKEDPDVVFVVRGLDSKDTIKDDLAKNPVWSKLKAVRNRRVYEVKSFPWSVGGTRSARLALDAAMTRMYPEEFPEPLK